MPVLDIQRRFVELGRIRGGEKGDKGQPQKRSTWRLTSASRALLEAGSSVYGGEVRPWEGAPNEGYFELLTESAELHVCVPPVAGASDLLTQWYEQWGAGGCLKRCDGVVERLSGKACTCDPDERACDLKTRMSLILPRLPGLGVWRLESGGINAALELPGNFELLVAASRGQFVEASLRLEQRVKKEQGQPTKRFAVPVLNFDTQPIGPIMEAVASGALMAVPQGPRPELPAAPDAPNGDSASFVVEDAEPSLGTPPPLPSDVAPIVEATPTAEPKPLTKPQATKLGVLVGRLRDDAHAITTDQLWAAVAKMRKFPAEDMIELLGGRDAEGVLHFGPLLADLRRDEASALIDRLEKLEVPSAA